MARTFQRPGLTLTHTAAGAISAGDVVVMGDIIGIALGDAATGETVEVSVEGVHLVPKVAGTAWGQGAKVDYDASAASGAGSFDIGVTAASGDVEDCGVAALAAGSADTTGYLKLTPGTGTGA